MEVITLITKRRLEYRLQAVLAQLEIVGEKLQSSREHQDLSENAEYEASLSEFTALSTERSKIEHTLSNSTIKKNKSNSIERGTLISLELVKNGNFKDLGLYLFDSDGGATFSGVIGDTSPLGLIIDGGLSGIYEVKTPLGSVETYRVKIEPDSRLTEFLEKYPPETDKTMDSLLEGNT
jgi:hypothetical protein